MVRRRRKIEVSTAATASRATACWGCRRYGLRKAAGHHRRARHWQDHRQRGAERGAPRLSARQRRQTGGRQGRPEERRDRHRARGGGALRHVRRARLPDAAAPRAGRPRHARRRARAGAARSLAQRRAPRRARRAAQWTEATLARARPARELARQHRRADAAARRCRPPKPPVGAPLRGLRPQRRQAGQRPARRGRPRRLGAFAPSQHGASHRLWLVHARAGTRSKGDRRRRRRRLCPGRAGGRPHRHAAVCERRGGRVRRAVVV
mmetsp:Transcript_724/g.1841  ORF Transcript_724/g.1841 Transcript_724/m.1841 type:complete len:265 (+) Transcript_724:231-1025(+)